MLPKISVIVPVYNVEDYVCACIDSILQQTYQNLEIILVIDGSTDGSERLCRNYKDERIRIVSKENGGLSSARNAGIEVATGAFFSFIDSDDYIDRRMIETLYQDLAAFDADVACCNYDFCDEQSQIIKEHAAAVTATAVYDSAAALDRMLLEEYYKCYAWNKLYKRELFQQIRYPEGRLFEDIPTTYQIFRQVKQVSFNPASLYHYRIRAGSITAGKFQQKTYDMMIPIRHILSESKSDMMNLGCMLYTLYFIDNMIQGGVWDKEIYSFYREHMKHIPKTAFSQVSRQRKLQMQLCYRCAPLYRMVYTLLARGR